MGELTAGVGIAGVIVRPLKQHVDERGAVLHMLRGDSVDFIGFGEIYFSLINPGVVKAWKRHRRVTQHFAVPVGRIRLVLYDDRPDSPTHGVLAELVLGRPDRYALVRIPPNIWYGFQGVADAPSCIANCMDLPHDPSESEQVEPGQSAIPFCWDSC